MSKALVKELDSSNQAKTTEGKTLVGSIIASITGASRKQPIDTELAGLPAPVQEPTNTPMYVVIAVFVLLLGAAAFVLMKPKSE